MNLIDTPSVTFSPALADGAAHCDSHNFPKTCACGQPLVLANLSARQARALGLLTSGISGPPSTGSYINAGLSLFLANRLRAATALTGSTLYALTWKVRTTPSLRRICALRASALPTSDRDFIGWPTPAARDWKSASGSEEFLKARALQKRGKPLSEEVFVQISPRAIRYTASGQILNGSNLEVGNSGQLNPEHSRWLMGYPRAWQRCVVTAMQSFRKSPKVSSEVLCSPLTICRCGDDDEL
ncbi:hypothetical protein XccvBFoX4_gp11 [Xanthomonas phage FoX4]|uniref:Uncharacterized protein n=1 Tax=Xanthomonas phage FoX4 TaxID=2723900 RepID=A0A858WN87_9CAUD|nr:DNA methyltransferase [Xanthomonas phage FoX4]QJI52965.1 hypothetical protein XccvBFoX4_gp11 [Xanthomonas phage FoX4]